MEIDNSKCLTPKEGLSTKDKWIISLIGLVAFLIFSSPILLRLISPIVSLFGLKIIDQGKPTFLGFIISGVLFLLFIRMCLH